jgi:hypothetical protein
MPNPCYLFYCCNPFPPANFINLTLLGFDFYFKTVLQCYQLVTQLATSSYQFLPHFMMSGLVGFQQKCCYPVYKPPTRFLKSEHDSFLPTVKKTLHSYPNWRRVRGRYLQFQVQDSTLYWRLSNLVKNRAGGMAQVVEWALSSNSSTAKILKALNRKINLLNEMFPLAKVD